MLERCIVEFTCVEDTQHTSNINNLGHNLGRMFLKRCLAQTSHQNMEACQDALLL